MALHSEPLDHALTDLEHRQLEVFIDRLVARLFAVELADFSGVARRQSGDTDGLIEYLWGLREAYSEYAESLAQGAESSYRFLSSRFIKWAYDNNQFFELDALSTKRFHSAHRILLTDLGQALRRAATLEQFAAQVNRSLLRFVERLVRVFRPLALSLAALARGAEYSGELQLTLLGLEKLTLADPCVDLGCGRAAELVALLRGRGLSATGLDRLGTEPFVLAKDWFEVHFEPGSLGTIVSHLAFSLHFLHHHWHPGDRAYAYARKYMELVKSLKPGGLFAYVPGLPFIEPMLDPGEYSVEKLELPEPLATKMESLRDLGTGQSVAYVTHIRRRG